MTKREFDKLDSPLNAQERFQHATILRLEALIDMVSSIVEHLATKDSVAVTEIKSELALPEKEEIKQEIKKVPAPAPKRKVTKK